MEQLTLFSLSDHQAPLPEYQVRESSRARHVSLRVSYQGALEVVVPAGFDREEIPAILERRRGWITKTLKRIQHQRQTLPQEHTAEKPTQLALLACGEVWKLRYSSDRGTPLSLVQTQPLELTLRGNEAAIETCHALLRNWLQRKARLVLAPWLQRLSADCDLAYSRLTVRGQATRWGSCSSHQSISLNYKLLFLPPPVVDYVLIHELCHTVHMNHSKAFWRLVSQYCPTYEAARGELKRAWQYVPPWLDGASP